MKIKLKRILNLDILEIFSIYFIVVFTIVRPGWKTEIELKFQYYICLMLRTHTHMKIQVVGEKKKKNKKKNNSDML